MTEAFEPTSIPAAGVTYTLGYSGGVTRVLQERTLATCASFFLPYLHPGMTVLDCGCGPGSLTLEIAERVAPGQVVGIDLDPVLIEAAELDHPGPTWLAADLSELDLDALGVEPGFDVVVCAGNVMGFLDPATRQQVLEHLASTLADGGRIVTGFGSGGDYPFDEFFADVDAAGLTVELRLSTWDLRPFTAESDFLVAVLSKR